MSEKSGKRPEGLNLEYLRKITDEMINCITTPEYVEAMRAVGAAPKEMRLLESSRRLSPDALRAAGVKLPDGMRISSRYFEEGLPFPIEVGDPPKGGINVVNAINEVEPGFLDRVRESNPVLFRELLTPRDKVEIGLGGGDAAVGGCACGGAATVCGGAGGST